MQSSKGTWDSHRAFRLATGLAALMLVAGLAGLLAYSTVEAMANPSYSLADGYGLGRLPWMAILEVLVVAGATASILIGAATVLALGGWLRRIVAVVPLAVSGLWWFFAWSNAGVSGGACIDCPPRAFDPFTYAYSGPQLAFEMLILPAFAIAVLALTIATRRPGSAPYISPS
jgi:hypothetical protein